MSAPSPRISRAARMKKPKLIREESVLVYSVGKRDLRHRRQYLRCNSLLKTGSAIVKVVLM